MTMLYYIKIWLDEFLLGVHIQIRYQDALMQKGWAVLGSIRVAGYEALVSVESGPVSPILGQVRRDVYIVYSAFLTAGIYVWSCA